MISGMRALHQLHITRADTAIAPTIMCSPFQSFRYPGRTESAIHGNDLACDAEHFRISKGTAVHPPVLRVAKYYQGAVDHVPLALGSCRGIRFHIHVMVQRRE